MFIKHPVPNNLCIAIPVYNSYHTFPELIKKIHELYDFQPSQLIIVDDGSTDGLFEDFQFHHCDIIRHRKNLGKGQAILSAFHKASERKFSYILYLDADGQHPPEWIHFFIQKNLQETFDLIIGKRKMNPQMPWTRKLSNFIGTTAVSLRVGKKVWDTQSGFRLLKIPFMEKFSYRGKRYELETEILIKFIVSKAKVDYISIPTIYNEFGSHYKIISGIFRFWKIILYSFL